MKHKHYDMILLWANGAAIETSYAEIKTNSATFWEPVENPHWLESQSYRVKHPAKPCPERMEEYLNALLFLCALNNTDTPLATKKSILLALQPKE
jgi:hypothetical protein